MHENGPLLKAVHAHRAGELLFRLGLVGVAAAQAQKRLADPDLPWHLALGRVIAETREIPALDPLSFTHRPIRYIEFVSDLLLYGVMRMGGPLGLQLFGALVAVSIALLLLQRARGSGPLALASVALAFGAMGGWLLVRPATLSFALIALYAWVLDAHRRAPLTSRWALVALIPLTALWANVHGFVLLGLGLLGLHAAHAVVCRLARGKLGASFPVQEGDGAPLALAAFLGSLAASGLNVAGHSLLTAPLRASTDFSRIGEWQRPSFAFLSEQAPGVLAFALVALLGLSFGREEDGRRLPRGYDLSLWALSALLAASALRLIPVAILLVTPMLARRLASLTPPTPLVHVASGFAMWLVGPVMLATHPTSFGVGFEPAHFPEGAVRFAEAERPRGNLYDYLDFGGYVSWRLYPDTLTLVDGRSSWVHDEALLRKFHLSLRDARAFDELVREHALEWALVRAKPGDPFGAPLALDARWTMVYLDGLSAVYVKNDGPNAALARRGYRSLRHLTAPPAALDAALSGRVELEALSHDGKLAVTHAPDDARAWFFEGAAAVALGDAARWAKAKARLAELAPGHPLISAYDGAFSRK